MDPITSSTSAATSQSPLPSRPAATRQPSQQMDYMKLIVAQMRNLNPMDPSSGNDGLTTMMQAESLNQLLALNNALEQLQLISQTSYGSALLGRTVTGETETGDAVTGAVKSLSMGAEGPTLELTDGRRLRLADVTEVKSA
jgi:flagellar basal-body rod modification protein FlgD